MSIILGVNSCHADTAAAIIKDGRVVCAIEEERFTRKKHECGFPINSILACCNEARCNLEDIDYIGINSRPSNRLRKLSYVVGSGCGWDYIQKKLAVRGKRKSILDRLREYSGRDLKAQLVEIDHHKCHLYSAYHSSSFMESALLSIDGFGDFRSTVRAWGVDGKINELASVYFPHSLGVLYTAITQYLGFLNYGDEYKVMGMSGYGQNRYGDKLEELVKWKENGDFFLVRKYFSHFTESLEGESQNGSPKWGVHFTDSLNELLGPSRRPGEELRQYHFDIASSLQVLYERILFNNIDSVIKDTGCEKLSLAGGCSANSLANGKVIKETKAKEIYVHPAGGDSGGALGAAQGAYFEMVGRVSNICQSAYLGTELECYNKDEIKSYIDQRSDEVFTVEEFGDDVDSLTSKIAMLLNGGNVVGIIRGRDEWGPRALGNRSIIADPRREDLRDILNSKIKRREMFRPFAPAVLEEEADKWFVSYGPQTIKVPFMTEVMEFKDDKKKEVKAVCHIDGTGRLQTVTSSVNPFLYKLISAFRDLTGVPMIVNTSFNENEPIVHTATEAIDCFLRTRMDAVLVGTVLVCRDNCGDRFD